MNLSSLRARLHFEWDSTGRVTVTVHDPWTGELWSVGESFYMPPAPAGSTVDVVTFDPDKAAT